MKLLSFMIIFCLLWGVTSAMSAPIQLEKADVHSTDMASIEQGGKFFARNCMICHSLKYVQYNPLAKKLGITLDKMPLKDQNWWLGVVPPDLSVVAQSRGADWLVTYLHSFYQDNSRPLGSNNLLVNNTAMANPFVHLQGEQELIVDRQKLFTHGHDKKPRWFNVIKRTKAGSVTPAEFDQTVNDLVNFLVYVSDPHAAERKRLGWWVLGFLGIFLVLAYLLKREYWKDIR